MALTERKQVLKAGDTISELIGQADAPTDPISGSVHGKISDLTVEATGFQAVPTIHSPPTITGTVQVGETLTGHHGVWNDNNEGIDSYTYRWLADAVAIGGATSITYELTASEFDKVITFEEKAVNTIGTSAAALSAATDAVLAALPTNSVAPAITGTAQVGQTLTCSEGTWDDGGGTNTYAYQWLADDVEIEGETTNEYVPVVGDIGAELTCTVTATNETGSLDVTSAATEAVIAE